MRLPPVRPGDGGAKSSIRGEQLKQGTEGAPWAALDLATSDLDGRTKDVTDIETARAAVIRELTS